MKQEASEGEGYVGMGPGVPLFHTYPFLIFGCFMDNIISLEEEDYDEKPLCVVRLTRSFWSNSKGINTTIHLTYLKRQCCGFNILLEAAANIGAEEVWSRIVNIHQCCDGIYQVVPCNEYRDYESGYIDDYDYQLIPFVKPIESTKKVLLNAEIIVMS